MGRNPKGEMTLPEIRNLARQHNKIQTIKGIDTMSRAKLIAEIERMGYKINHEIKMIKKRPLSSTERTKSKIKVSSKGEAKPQKETRKKKEKARIKVEGPEPPSKKARKLKGRLQQVQEDETYKMEMKRKARLDLIRG